MNEGGYATMPPDVGGPLDGIVVTGFGILLAHEMGHYLGLYHTFQGMDCKNDDCSTDGDMVCDTPPQRDIFSSPSCSSPANSCSTDTLSGFTTDVPDLISNFMSYGNASCINEFTEGQSARMRGTIATVRSTLLANECTPPCGESSVASFTRDLPYPNTGNTVNFTNTSTGATQYISGRLMARWWPRALISAIPSPDCGDLSAVNLKALQYGRHLLCRLFGQREWFRAWNYGPFLRR